MFSDMEKKKGGACDGIFMVTGSWPIRPKHYSLGSEYIRYETWTRVLGVRMGHGRGSELCVNHRAWS